MEATTVPTENEELLAIIPGTTTLTHEQVGVISDFRKVWNELAYWMRDFIYSLVDNHENLYAVTNKVDATAMATFMARINPYWDVELWKNLLDQCISMKIEEILAIVQKDREIQIYNRIESHARIMESYMARGIIARGLVPGGQAGTQPEVQTQ